MGNGERGTGNGERGMREPGTGKGGNRKGVCTGLRTYSTGIEPSLFFNSKESSLSCPPVLVHLFLSTCFCSSLVLQLFLLQSP